MQREHGILKASQIILFWINAKTRTLIEREAAMKSPDILEFIRNALTADATTMQRLEPVLAQARQTYGGDTVYVRIPRPEVVSRRTVQRRLRAERAAL